MTITLTPELENAVNERARGQGIEPERLALEELNRLFLAMPAPPIVRMEKNNPAWTSLIHRYNALIEKEFTTGLTAQEEQESERLGAEIDAAEMFAANAQ